MLRYFYLLSLIIYIKETICYDHARPLRLKPKRFGKRLLNSDSHIVKNNNYDHNIKRRQGNGLIENDFTQIDVASFIQKPDSYADEDKLLSQTYDFKSQLMPKHFTDYDDVNTIMKNMHIRDHSIGGDKKAYTIHKTDDYINYHDLEISPIEMINGDLKYLSQHDPSSPKKKYHWNYNMKFPFFFHRDNVSLVNMLNNSKKRHHNYIDTSDNDHFPQRGINKRANKDSKNLIYKTEKEKRCLGKSIFHNSRQYYQNLIGDSNQKKYTDKPLLEKKDDETMKPETLTQTDPVTATQTTKCYNGDDKKNFRKRKGNIHRKKNNIKRKKYNDNYDSN